MSILRKVKIAFLADNFLARLVKTFIVPLGFAALFYQIIAKIAVPRWIAPGWSYFNGYPKNVEVTAITGGLLAGAVSVLLSRKTTIYTFLLPIGFLGVGVTVYLYQGSSMTIASSVGLPLLMGGIFLALWNEPPNQSEDKPKASQWRTHTLCVTLLAFSAFFLNQRHYEVIDTFHMGQELITALNLLDGGIPFETFYLPHGLHDSVLPALWIAITGKVGTSPLALSFATQAAVGAVALYLFSLHVLGSIEVAFGVTAIGAFLGIIVAEKSWWSYFLWTFHYWFFAILGFCILTSGLRFRTFLAGVAIGLGHIWRIDIGVYSFIVLTGILAYIDFVACPKVGSTFRIKLRTFTLDGSSLVAGVGITILLVYMFLGWPNLSWYHAVFRQFPLYHIEASGLPFPTVYAIDPIDKVEQYASAYKTLVLALLLIMFTINVVLGDLFRNSHTEPPPVASRWKRKGETLVFLGLLAALSLRTALGRSDMAHITFSNPILVIGSYLLIAALAKTRFNLTVHKTLVMVGLMIVLINARDIGVGLPQFEPPWNWTALAWRTFHEHVSDNPPAGPCDDVMYTSTEAGKPNVWALIVATCKVERQLQRNGIRRLLIDNSAPWYYVRFGTLPLPTRYSYLSWAYTPNQQWKLIEDLMQSQPQALLKVKNFNALPNNSGVPNGITIPIVEVYLQERRKGVKPIRSNIGDLYIYNNPKYHIDPPPDRPFSPVPTEQAAMHTHFVVDSLVYAPSGFLTGYGWAIELKGGWTQLRAIDRLFLFSGDRLVGEITYGLRRQDVANHLGNKTLIRVGWTIDLFIATTGFDGSELGVRLLLRDGRNVDFRLDTSKLRKLPRLTGQEWDHLPTAVLEAQRLARDL